MKKLYILLAASFLLGAPALATAAEPQLMRVSADAEVRVKPDRAAVTFGVFEKTDTLKEGTERLNNTVGRVMNYLKKRGIKDRSIQTDSLQISPVYANQKVYSNKGIESEKETVKYELSQTFTVTLEDPSEYEDVLYALLNMGINRVENVSFYSTQMRQYRDEARRLAVKHASEKAELLADAAGIKLGKVVNVTEDYASTGFRYAASNVSQNVVTEGGSADTVPATGMIPVKAAVTLTYKVK